MRIESIGPEGSPVCYLVRGDALPTQTEFPSSPHLNLQAGFVVHPAGDVISRHVHAPAHREIEGTAEVLFVLRGRCEIDVYGEDRNFLATRELAQGDLMIMVGGGHGFRMIEDTVLLEVKQGPYGGPGEKEQF